MKGTNYKLNRDLKLYIGKEYKCDSDAYQELLDNVYISLFNQSESFRNALKATGSSSITHSIGKNKINETVLTQTEFCSRLLKLRNWL